MSHNLGKFTSCPACGQEFGIAPRGLYKGRWQPPSLRLELCGEVGGAVEWRLSTFGVDRQDWPSPGFRQAGVRYVYWLCGGGHLFLDHVVLNHGHPSPKWQVEKFDVAAAVGGVAAGKSYLLLRALSQQLTPIGLDTAGTPARAVQRVQSHVLEAKPMKLLSRQYANTSQDGTPITATTTNEMLPSRFLADHVSRDLVGKIREIHRELIPDEYADPARWGNSIRQPIVQRYTIGGRNVFTAVADMAGESFESDEEEVEYQRNLLGSYESLLWVIDPVVARPFLRLLPDDVRGKVRMASMRPDGDVEADVDAAQRYRENTQRNVADQLSYDVGTFGGTRAGPEQRLQVCFTKADLVLLALRQGKRLDELGRAGEVVDGVARYLVHVATCASGPGQRMKVTEATWNQVVEQLALEAHEPLIRREHALHVARELVRHFSDPDAFWNLVHHGDADEVKIPTGALPSETPGRIDVPALDVHLRDALNSVEPLELHPRDLVMSALTCGLVHGLGFGQPVGAMLGQTWRQLRFFLCSPLTEVPVMAMSSAEHFRPMDGNASFALQSGRSAGLTQLQLTLLAGVRS
jgi:hypothetical protein